MAETERTVAYEGSWTVDLVGLATYINQHDPWDALIESNADPIFGGGFLFNYTFVALIVFSHLGCCLRGLQGDAGVGAREERSPVLLQWLLFCHIFKGLVTLLTPSPPHTSLRTVFSNADGLNLIEVAALHRCYRTVALLHKAARNAREPPDSRALSLERVDWDRVDRHSQVLHLMHRAVEVGNKYLVKELIARHGQDVNLTTPGGSVTPFEVLIRSKRYKLWPMLRAEAEPSPVGRHDGAVMLDVAFHQDAPLDILEDLASLLSAHNREQFVVRNSEVSLFQFFFYRFIVFVVL